MAACAALDWQLVGFVDFASGNYRLAPVRAYYYAGTDGKDLGCRYPWRAGRNRRIGSVECQPDATAT